MLLYEGFIGARDLREGRSPMLSSRQLTDNVVDILVEHRTNLLARRNLTGDYRDKNFDSML